MDLAGFSFIIFIIHVGFLAPCPNTASAVLEPAAVKHTMTRPFLREAERGGGEMSTAEKHGFLPHFETNNSKYLQAKRKKKNDAKGGSVLSDCSHLWGEK